VVEFTAWGEFTRAWGWDVVEAGPNDDTAAPEDQFEICVPTEGDVCQAGTAGGGSGQFNSSQGLAIDSGGAVYAVDFSNRRVQKFDSEGNFVLMLGGNVNKTKVDEAAPEAARNLCTAASGDVCQAGTSGGGDGQFGTWRAGNFIAISSDDEVWVGDQNRIQSFSIAGAFQGDIELPGKTVQSLAVDSTGNLYVAFWKSGTDSEGDVHKMATDGTPLSPTFPVTNPRGIAVDGDGNVYVIDKVNAEARAEALQFDSGANLLVKFAEDLNVASTGIATGSPGACGLGATPVYVTNTTPAFLRAYTPVPDPDLCPRPLRPPLIENQFATSVGTGEATVGADVNPRFWEDTTYYVEYGTVDCAVGPCQRALFPGATLTTEVVNEPIAAGGCAAASARRIAGVQWRSLSPSRPSSSSSSPSPPRSPAPKNPN